MYPFSSYATIPFTNIASSLSPLHFLFNLKLSSTDICMAGFISIKKQNKTKTIFWLSDQKMFVYNYIYVSCTTWKFWNTYILKWLNWVNYACIVSYTSYSFCDEHTKSTLSDLQEYHTLLLIIVAILCNRFLELMLLHCLLLDFFQVCA